MKKIFERIFKYCLAALLLLNVYSSRAQYVTLPDTNFVNWLKGNGYSGCLNGQQLDTTCPAVLNAVAMHCSAYPIRDLTGIQYFKGLDTLDCSNDSLYFIPSFPGNLVMLSCARNNLTTIPALPANLTLFDCSNNQITAISQFPSGLVIIVTDYNQLTSIPALPAALVLSSFQHNNLTAFPSIPAGTAQVACDYNQITSLPAIPASMQALTCGNNLLTAIPTLPSGLTQFWCYYNLLTTMPALPSTITDLDISYNQITTIPSFPPGVTTMSIAANPLTTIPALPTTLTRFVASDCRLTALPALPPSLNALVCNGNQLTSLPALPSTLTDFECDSNQLTSVPAFPPLCYIIELADNQLTSLPALPDSMDFLDITNNVNLACLPRFTHFNFLRFTGTAVTCLPNYGTVQSSNPALSSLPLCGLINGTGCSVDWSVSGTVYDDVNTNCLFDNTDVGLGYYKVIMLSNGNVLQQVYTSYDGSYSFQAPFGSYVVSADTTVAPFVPSCPLNNVITGVLSSSDSLQTGKDFAVVCRSQGFDVGITSIVYDYTVTPRPAAIVPVYSVAGDLSALFGAHCAAGLSGKLQIIFNGEVQYMGPAPGALAPDNVTGNTLTWNIADFGNVNNRSDFNLIFGIDTFATAGTQICFTETITPDSGDYNLSNNTLSYCFTIVNALDPNEKEVYPTTIDSAGQWLTYTIRFQNTGTAPAQNILVTDTLDSHLDPSTFQLLAYSAKNTTQLFGNIVKFNFVNINLPDSGTSNTLSRGYVQFRIKTASPFSNTETISNTANIYFDLNPAVVTNTVVDSVAPGIVNSVPVVNKDNAVYIYPNPASSQLFIKTENLQARVITVYDIDGRMIFTQPFAPQINIQQLTGGVYFIEVSNGVDVVRKRFVKM